MDARLQEKLLEAGDKLRANHDEAVIADLIGECEALETESGQITADLLHHMVAGEE